MAAALFKKCFAELTALLITFSEGLPRIPKAVKTICGWLPSS